MAVLTPPILVLLLFCVVFLWWKGRSGQASRTQAPSQTKPSEFPDPTDSPDLHQPVPHATAGDTLPVPLPEEPSVVMPPQEQLDSPASTPPEAVQKANPSSQSGAQLSPVGDAPETPQERVVPAQGRSTITPEKRGGSSRGPRVKVSIAAPQVGPKQEEKPVGSIRAPEIVCWESEASWQIGMHFPLLSESDVTVISVVQANGVIEPLKVDREIRYPLGSVTQPVEVLFSDGTELTVEAPAANEEEAVLFRLPGGVDSHQGRMVRKCGTGSYLVVTPRNAELDGLPEAIARIEPEPARGLPGYMAHVLSIGPGLNGDVLLRGANGSRVAFHVGQPTFHLDGHKLLDDTETGPLFGPDAPRLCGDNESVWDEAKTVVLGEEGHGRNRWRTHFHPENGSSSQSLEGALDGHGAGWFYVRVYDVADRLVDSLDFRFVRGLKAIEVQPTPALPGPDGHGSSLVCFRHAPEVTVDPAEAALSQTLMRSTPTQFDGTTFQLPADPEFDKTNWRLSVGGASAYARVSIDHVWWGLSDGGRPKKWLDRELALSREEFRRKSRTCLWVRVPPSMGDSVFRFGFEESEFRPYRVDRGSSMLTVALRDFSDAIQIEGKQAFRFFLSLDQSEPTVVLRSQRLRCAVTRDCTFEAETEEDIVKHIKDCHLDRLYRRLTYQDIRQRVGKLPVIYQCKYCGHVVVARGDADSATSLMTDHIQNRCDRAKAYSTDGRRQVDFAIVTDPDVAARILEREFPRFGCAFCHSTFGTGSPDEVLEHWRTTPGHVLFEPEPEFKPWS